MYKNEIQVKRHILWEVLNGTKSTNLTVDLTMENFVYCCIKNANNMRKVFYKIVTNPKKNFFVASLGFLIGSNFHFQHLKPFFFNFYNKI